MNSAIGYNGTAAVWEGIDHENSHVKMQRSMKFSLYPARPRTPSKSSTPSMPPSPVDHTALQLPQLHHIMPREEYHQRPYTSHNTHSNERSFTAPPVALHSLHRNPSDASRLRALNNGHRSNSTDAISERQVLAADNFSRPRQPSIRRRNDSPKPLHPASKFPLGTYDEQQTPTDLDSSRDRGFSTSSSQSPTNLPAYAVRPSPSIPDYQVADSIYSRQRNLTNPQHRPWQASSRPDSNHSAQRRDPIPRPNGFDSEEVRTSFRSAATTNSSFMGTIGTERSSVMTKSSSSTSIYGPDEGMSVDDAIGMYESGFMDSGVEDNDITRPNTPDSQRKRISGLHEAIDEPLVMTESPGALDSNDSLMPPSTARIVRDSHQIFHTVGRPSEDVPRNGDGTLDIQDGSLESPSRPVTRAAVAPFDETRDRYGFRKKTQYVSLETYEAWNTPYTEYLARRRKKWIALLKDEKLVTDRPIRFPAKSAKVKRFIRKGIPPDWRGDAWFWYAGGPAMVSKNYGVYTSLLKRAAAGDVNQTDEEIIERDLNRTFPDNIKFKPDPPPLAPGEIRNSQQVEPETPILKSLRHVLQAFSIHNPRIGYCQSLNFLAGLLLLFMEEEKAFWMLNIITTTYLPGTHEINLEGANVDLGVLMTSIKDMMPQIWAKIGGELDGSSLPHSTLRLPPITLCTTAWFMSCFIGTLPIESTLRVWDSFFCEGSKTLFRIALTIFKLGEAEIKAVSDPMEIFQLVQNFPRKLVDCNALMEACYKRRNGFGHLSQETIEKGRVERRKGYADEREREKERAAIGNEADGGGVKRSGTRKGTMFGRKKKAIEV
ncbi:related to GTPase-activating protein GYP3 [Rhynchosporium agropyri]|uniref:Related to GTPase-activating protein GYP3 n=1 Tax=Rhynchosporium agropyri TaxID=914238 RepID=A0A1E1LD16_9HELO|nr:related to GTPase-activating protein GYP3 [Rhynchosporium agropyri]